MKFTANELREKARQLMEVYDAGIALQAATMLLIAADMAEELERLRETLLAATPAQQETQWCDCIVERHCDKRGPVWGNTRCRLSAGKEFAQGQESQQKVSDEKGKFDDVERPDHLAPDTAPAADLDAEINYFANRHVWPMDGSPHKWANAGNVANAIHEWIAKHGTREQGMREAIKIVQDAGGDNAYYHSVAIERAI